MKAQIVYIRIPDGKIVHTTPTPAIGELWQACIYVETRAFKAYMPFHYQLAGLAGETMPLRKGLNLYKQSYADARTDIAYTKKFVEAISSEQTEWFSVELFDATMRALVVEKDQYYHYATEGDVLECISEDASYRAAKFGPDWFADSRYNFWERDDQPQGDIIMTHMPRTGMAVYSADCVIALVYDPISGAVCVSHSMWRQLVDNGTMSEDDEDSIMETIVKVMNRQYDSDPRDLEVILFPCASRLNYEVSPETAQKFYDAGIAEAVHRESKEKRFTVDLNEAASMLFQRAGIPAANIGKIGFTTDDPEFASLRNSQKCGRMPFFYGAGELKLDSDNPGAQLSAANSQNILFVETI